MSLSSSHQMNILIYMPLKMYEFTTSLSGIMYSADFRIVIFNTYIEQSINEDLSNRNCIRYIIKLYIYCKTLSVYNGWTEIKKLRCNKYKLKVLLIWIR